MSVADNDQDLDDLLGLSDSEEAPVEAPKAEKPAAKRGRPAAPKADKIVDPTPATPTIVEEDAPAAPLTPEEPTVPVVTQEEAAESRRIAELRAQLAQPTLKPTTDESGRPLPESELTPAQREIRLLEDQVAKKLAKELDQEELSFVAPVEGDDMIHIHFLEDGHTAWGAVWFRGQEVRISRASGQFLDTKDRFGNSWMDLSEFDQIDVWGKIMFRAGPWPGLAYDDPTAARAEARRRGGVPVTKF